MADGVLGPDPQRLANRLYKAEDRITKLETLLRAILKGMEAKVLPDIIPSQDLDDPQTIAQMARKYYADSN